MAKINFKGNKILITGASSGIGKALAVEFAQRGAHLGLGALPRETDLVASVAGDIKQRFGVKTWCFPIDLAKADGPDALYASVKSEMGDIDVLVNNAGIAFYGEFRDQPWEPLARTIHLNLHVPAKLMHLFIPHMIRQGHGLVINTSSVSALQPTPYQTVYGATKAGLQSLSQAVRAELMGTGVTVCTFNPPYTKTDILNKGGFPENLRWYAISGLKRPEWIAEKAVKAFEKGKFLYVPGFSAWLFHIVLVRFSPRRLVDFVSRYFLRGGSLTGR
ncbi:MAG: hypothetical protein COX19_14490 [Desulfobacterales bacterium CG23_combo_of_CG06-09_8_20_14_all_51_8]|nr:MAG: hypothetical protein COX19_14490 [Desulfobacterales bacterium CG23_combo_of_CG06-09_8_20_14_all_51_8]